MIVRRLLCEIAYQRRCQRGALSFEEVLAEARAGSKAALGSVLEACRHCLLREARRHLRPHLQRKGGASDLVQDTFLEAQRDFSTFHGHSRNELLAWLHRILANTFITGYRKRRREPRQAVASDYADWHAQGDPLASAARSAEAEALDRLADSEILRALRDLPEEFRVAVYLADIEGYAYKEIADIMGTPIGTVMSRLHRGRGRLRDKLAAYAPGQALPGLTG